MDMIFRAQKAPVTIATRTLLFSLLALSVSVLTVKNTAAQQAEAEQTVGSYVWLEGITVTSTKTETDAIDALGGVSVVTRQDIDRIQPGNISEMLQAVPGVEVRKDGDDPASAINIRGLQDFGRINVMIDGARQNFQRSGHSADGQFYLEPELVKAVDITRGPVSTIYGSGAIGGVVNFELIDPEDILYPGEKWALHTKGQYNTNDEGWLVSSTGALKVGPSVSVLGNVVWREDDDYEDGAGQRVPLTGDEIISGLVKGKIDAGQGHSLELSYLYQEHDYITRDPDNVESTQRQTEAVDETATAKWRYTPSGNELVDLTLSAYYTSTELDQTRLTIPNPCPPAFCSAVLGNQRSFAIETVGLDAFNTSKFNTGHIRHTLTYGGDIFKDEVETNDPAGTGDEFTPSGERQVYGAFIQDVVDFGEHLQVIGALRFDGYEVDSEAGNSNGTRLSPKLTVGITPVQGIQFFASYSEGYRAPAVTELFNLGTHDIAFPFQFLPNPDLDPETAKNTEFGVNLKFDDVLKTGDRFRAKATYFHNEVENFIEPVLFADPTATPAFVPVLGGFGFFPGTVCAESGTNFNAFGQFTGAPPFCFQYQNIAKARFHGIELEASYDARRWFAQLSFSHIRADNKVTGTPLYSDNPDKFSGTIGVRLLDEKLILGGTWTWLDAQDRIAFDETGDPLFGPTEEFNLFDLFATYEHSRYFAASLNLKNITDEDYRVYRELDPGAGFSAVLSATVKLGG